MVRKINYTINVQTDDTNNLYFEAFRKQIIGHYIAGHKDYIVDDINETPECLTIDEHCNTLSTLLQEQEINLYNKFVNVMREFCKSKEEEDAIAKLLEEEFNK